MSKIEIKTTQNINLFFQPASLGERLGAIGIDLLILGGYITVLVYIISEFDLWKLFGYLDRWSSMAIVLILSAPVSLYPLVTESLMQGQTIGKRALKIRVIKIDGYQASFTDFLIRWLFAIVEINLMGGVIALISVISSKHSQRLGDFAAGTAVISERNITNISHTILEELAVAYEPLFSQAEVFLFSDNDVQTIKKFFQEASKKQNTSILDRLAQKITEISHRENIKHTNSAEFIQKFLKDYNFHTGK